MYCARFRFLAIETCLLSYTCYCYSGSQTTSGLWPDSEDDLLYVNHWHFLLLRTALPYCVYGSEPCCYTKAELARFYLHNEMTVCTVKYVLTARPWFDSRQNQDSFLCQCLDRFSGRLRALFNGCQVLLHRHHGRRERLTTDFHPVSRLSWAIPPHVFTMFT
jgi:hypothetical protein